MSYLLYWRLLHRLLQEFRRYLSGAYLILTITGFPRRQSEVLLFSLEAVETVISTSAFILITQSILLTDFQPLQLSKNNLITTKKRRYKPWSVGADVFLFTKIETFALNAKYSLHSFQNIYSVTENL
jgi:hypothetical protein